MSDEREGYWKSRWENSDAHAMAYARECGTPRAEWEYSKKRIAELEADITERTQRETNLRSDWLEARERITELETEAERLRRDIGLLVDPLWFKYGPDTGVCGWCDNGDSGEKTNDDGHDENCIVSHYYHKHESPFTRYEERLFATIEKLEAENADLRREIERLAGLVAAHRSETETAR